MKGYPDDEAALPRALRTLWEQSPPTRRAGGLTRDRIISAAVDLADAEGLTALSMARLADRLHCGTMSLYRHVASKDELLIFMLAAAPGPPPTRPDHADAETDDWRGALIEWAAALWDVYHRHPWILDASSARPPADPGQLAWLEAGLGALRPTRLSEREKVSSVISLLHYVRGAASMAIESSTTAGDVDWSGYPAMLREVVDPRRFPSIAAALAAGAFDTSVENGPRQEFLSGVAHLADGIAALVKPLH